MVAIDSRWPISSLLFPVHATPCVIHRSMDRSIMWLTNIHIRSPGAPKSIAAGGGGGERQGRAGRSVREGGAGRQQGSHGRRKRPLNGIPEIATIQRGGEAPPPSCFHASGVTHPTHSQRRVFCQTGFRQHGGFCLLFGFCFVFLYITAAGEMKRSRLVRP